MGPFAIEYSRPRGIIPWPANMRFSRDLGNKPAPSSVIIQMGASVPDETPNFDQLMLPHLDAAYNLASWLLRDRHDAEDAVQDACLRAYRGFSGFRGGDGRAWLLTIVRNVCYSRLRRDRRAPEEVAFEEDVHGSAAEGAGAGAVAWTEVRSEILGKALERLAPEYREVVVLHEIEGMAYKEIAAVAQIPIGTVMSRLARARARLQAEARALAAEAHAS
jgi:RNA polymerase sigma-70 factor (ECF subfamily)